MFTQHTTLNCNGSVMDAVSMSRGHLRTGLPHGAWAGARTSLGCDAVAHEGIAALDDLILLLVRQQVLAVAQEEPHRPHPRPGLCA